MSAGGEMGSTVSPAPQTGVEGDSSGGGTEKLNGLGFSTSWGMDVLEEDSMIDILKRRGKNLERSF